MRKARYFYNPETDGFEREFPSLKRFMLSAGKYLLTGIIAGGLFYFLASYAFETPTEESLRKENATLKSRLRVLDSRVEEALKVLEEIALRDDNFYRSLMNTEPVNRELRYDAGVERSSSASVSSDALMNELERRTDLLEHQISVQSQSFEELRFAAASQGERLRRIPSILPLSGNRHQISSGFGYRRDPIRGVMKLHPGIDWSVQTGTPVMATAPGKVKVTGHNAADGIFIEIDHGYNYTTRYTHLGECGVSEGQQVNRGDIIAATGSSGKSAGPHLHYEVRFKDSPQNPADYFFENLTPREYESLLMECSRAGAALD